MAENESVEMVEEVAEEVVEEMVEEAEELVEEAEELVGGSSTPEPSEKPGLFGQTPSMWFLIDSAVVLLIVIIMRVTA